MARFNEKKKSISIPNTTNLAGGQAFTVSPKLEMASILLTSFAKDQFYRSGDQTVARLAQLVNSEPEFASKAAVYARNVFGMRTITHIVAALIARDIKGERWTKDFISKVIRRPDDATEIMALYLNSFGKPIPNSLKKGIAMAMGKFDEYRLAKYRMANHNVKLVDLFNLVHPKPNAKNSEVYSKLIKDELRSFDTWEVDISEAGDDEEKKATAWTDLVESKKMGYFALLRNLRNISNQAPDALKVALERLVDPEEVKHSMVFPFQYLVAMDNLPEKNTAKIKAAISDAMEVSLSNVPDMPGNTLVAVDTSGSMQPSFWYNPFGSDKRGSTENTCPAAIASTFGAALFKSQEIGNVDAMEFSTKANYVNLNPRDSLATMAKALKGRGGQTHFNEIFRTANKPYDRIIILSDMQALSRNEGMTAFKNYKSKYEVNPTVYSVDLAGYGSIQFPEKKVCSLAGFSEKIFDIMALVENDRNALINTIEAVNIT